MSRNLSNTNAGTGFPGGLGKPATRALKSGGYTRLEELDGVAKAKLSALHGMGPKALGILEEALEARGMGFGSE